MVPHLTVWKGVDPLAVPLALDPGAFVSISSLEHSFAFALEKVGDKMALVEIELAVRSLPYALAVALSGVLEPFSLVNIVDGLSVLSNN